MSKELGKGVENAIDKMDAFIKSLKDFSKAAIKNPLLAHDPDGKLGKMVKDVQVDAFNLMHDVEALKAAIKTIKPSKPSRFAKRVVTKYLEGL